MVRERGKNDLMIVVRKKLDNLSLGENFLYAKEDELNSLKIIFLKMNFEFI